MLTILTCPPHILTFKNPLRRPSNAPPLHRFSRLRIGKYRGLVPDLCAGTGAGGQLLDNDCVSARACRCGDSRVACASRKCACASHSSLTHTRSRSPSLWCLQTIHITCTSYVEYLRNILATSLTNEVMHGVKAERNGMFAPACLAHCLQWDGGVAPTVGGVNHRDAFTRWFIGAEEGAAAMRLNNTTSVAALMSCSDVDNLQARVRSV